MDISSINEDHPHDTPFKDVCRWEIEGKCVQDYAGQADHVLTWKYKPSMIDKEEPKGEYL